MKLQWSISAGGTFAAEGKNGYSVRVENAGEYHISPICWPNSLRHRGYVVRFANTYGIGVIRGLWQAINPEGYNIQTFREDIVTLREAKRRVKLHLEKLAIAA